MSSFLFVPVTSFVLLSYNIILTFKEQTMFNYSSGNNYSNNNSNFRGSMEDFETLQNARKDLIGEWEAIIQYDEHLHNTNVSAAKSTWENIRNEELVHVGELLGLLFYLAPYQKQYIEEGFEEFNKRGNK